MGKFVVASHNDVKTRPWCKPTERFGGHLAAV